jgi:hypothetical protein
MGVTPLEMFAAVFYFLGYFCIFAGIGDLIDRVLYLLLAAMSFPMAILVLYAVMGFETVSYLVSILPYLIITLSLLWINHNYQVTLELLIVGWGTLLMVNTGWVLEFIHVYYVELMAIFSKIVIFFGMLNPQFSLMVDDLRQFLITGSAQVFTEESFGRFFLVRPEENSGGRDSELRWIRDIIDSNKTLGIRTVLISTYDILTRRDLNSWGIREEDIYLVRMIIGGGNPTGTFEDYTMTMDDDMDKLDIFFSDIVEFSRERKAMVSIIIYNISNLLHTHNWRRGYSFLISKLSTLKNSRVNLYCFYHPQTHENIADIVKFEKLADDIITV